MCEWRWLQWSARRDLTSTIDLCGVTDIPWVDNGERILSHMIPCGMERWMVVGKSCASVKQGERCWELAMFVLVMMMMMILVLIKWMW